ARVVRRVLARRPETAAGQGHRMPVPAGKASTPLRRPSAWISAWDAEVPRVSGPPWLPGVKALLDTFASPDASGHALAPRVHWHSAGHAPHGAVRDGRRSVRARAGRCPMPKRWGC